MKLGKWVLWAPVAVYAGVIFYISSCPPLDLGPGQNKDKIAHFLGYVPFGFLMTRAVSGTWRRSKRCGAGSWGAAALYGASDEIHQHFIPGRTADYQDWIADLLGIGLGVLIYWLGSARHHNEMERISDRV